MSPQPLHVAVAALIERIFIRHKIKVEVREIFRSGKSGAFVGLVDCSGSRDGVYVLKVDLLPSGWEGEVTKHAKALDDGAFSKKIPSIILSEETATHYALLLKIAGESRITWRPLVNSLGLFSSAYTKLSKIAWDPRLFQFGDMVSAPEMIKASLSYKIDERKGGRIRQHVAKFLRPSLLTSQTFVHCDRVLPNPFFFVGNAAEATPSFRPLLGPVHGDCHSQNLFIKARRDGAVDDVFLIDFASYQSRSVFFFDHAYLELATALREFDRLGEKRWLAFVTALSDLEQAIALEPQERGWLREISDGRMEALIQIANYPDRGDDLKMQFSLMQVAAGLAFLNKVPREGLASGGLSAAQYQQSFVWAATFLNAFVRQSGSDIQGFGDSISDSAIPVLGAAMAQTGPAPTTQEWLQVAYFDANGFNILVLPPTTQVSPAILEMHWNVVVDFNVTAPDEAIFNALPRLFRQAWPGHLPEDMKLLTRGGLWYFANGRADMSGIDPTASYREWRRKYARLLEDALIRVRGTIAPPRVRVLILGDGLPPEHIGNISEIIDSAFQSALAPIIVASKYGKAELPSTVEAVASSLAAVETTLNAERQPRLTHPNVPLLPCRRFSDVVLEPAPTGLLQRISRDFTVVYRGQAQVFPDTRTFGVDFRRGMRIEWAELAQDLDVPRDAFDGYAKDIREKLQSSNNHTVNLLHQPSAGGTTLARRIAWEFMENFPVVWLDQVSDDSASHLRDLFRHCSLSVLVVMDSIATESEREGLLQQLREDNTRVVFLWVARAYGSGRQKHVLPRTLSPSEARKFSEVYCEQVADPNRRRELERLASAPELKEQRNPFFFGLTAFGERFLGVERLIGEIVEGAVDVESRKLLSDLALVSIYSNEGFPTYEFNELCARHNNGEWPVESDSLFVLYTADYVKVSHTLLAEKALAALARNPRHWQADLLLFSLTLVDHLSMMTYAVSHRVQDLVQTLFITRDIESALQADTDVQSGGIAAHRRFSPLIGDVGSVAQARTILERVAQQWPSEPHYAAHLARHYLYEEPREIEKALHTAQAALSATPEASLDAALVHTVGMTFRVRMEELLNEARHADHPISDWEDLARRDYNEAISYFNTANALKPSNEHGYVATVQAGAALIRHAVKLSGSESLRKFLEDPGRRWYLDVLALSEDCIEELRDRPHLTLSLRSQRAIAEWNLVYGNVDAVVAELRKLAEQHEDRGVRRALCSALISRADHNWKNIDQDDLEDILRYMERNINHQGVTDADVRRWLNAYRHLNRFDLQIAIERLIDWYRLKPQAVEPVYYLYIFYFLRWLEASPPRDGYANEVLRWLKATQENRPLGHRTWSYEWLAHDRGSYLATRYNELGFDPPTIVRTMNHPDRATMEAQLVRVVGVMRDYRGPQYASLDLGGGLRVRITPLDRLSKDDEGKRVASFVSFSYDGLVGWDPALITAAS